MFAAADVFAENGIRAASLTEVAERAGYTIGAVYSNFASKDDLVQAIMSNGLDMFERSLAASLADMHQRSADPGQPLDDLLERELDRMEAAEDAVPGRWWRLLYEYRTYTAADPVARAKLADSERRCREILARYIDGFLATIRVVPPLPPIELAELTTALTDGLRAAHMEGRASMTPGQGLRLVVRALIATGTPADPT
jgi:AcrR family transcriptional regulator